MPTFVESYVTFWRYAAQGLEDNLVRGCMFKVPEGAKQLTLIQVCGLIFTVL